MGSGDDDGGGSERDFLRVQELRKTFGSHEVLKGVSFSLRRKEVVGIIGASGSGKSTLLRCLNLLEMPTSGSIEFLGEEMGFTERSDGRRVPRSGREIAGQRSRMGMVFQSFNLWPHRSVLENVIEGPVVVKGMPRQQAEQKARLLLEKVGLAEKADAYPGRLSGGQQQRVGIARALCMDPEILLFDEPTSALDPELVGEVLTVIGELAAEGTTMIIVTHEMRFAHEACNRIIFLDQGLLADEGPPDHIFGDSAGERTRAFVSRYVSTHLPASAGGASQPQKRTGL